MLQTYPASRPHPSPAGLASQSMVTNHHRAAQRRLLSNHLVIPQNPPLSFHLDSRAFLKPRETFPHWLFLTTLSQLPIPEGNPRRFRRSPGHQDLSSRLLSETVGCCCVLFCLWSFFSPNKGPLLQWHMLKPHNACCRRGLITQLHLSKCHFSDRP